MRDVVCKEIAHHDAGVSLARAAQASAVHNGKPNSRLNSASTCIV